MYRSIYYDPIHRYTTSDFRDSELTLKEHLSMIRDSRLICILDYVSEEILYKGQNFDNHVENIGNLSMNLKLIK